MKLQEIFARGIFMVIIVGLPIGIFGYQFVWKPAHDAPNTYTIQAYAPEAGGFAPEVIRVNKGEPLTLHFTSMDVTHGVAIGGDVNINLGHIDPGEFKTLEMTFDEAGTYTFYCTTWCSKDHWRMRGVIEVYDPENPDFLPASQSDPIIENLIAEGVNIDMVHSGNAVHSSEMTVPQDISSLRGEEVIDTLIVPEELRNADWRFTHEPLDALTLLHEANPDSDETVLADAVAYLWSSELSFTDETKRLYEQDCAACHGQTGNAEGPGALTTAVTPVAFADSQYMFAMRGDVLYAKIRRGGMGTDMPNFGTLYTRDQTRELVDYLWSLGLQSEVDE